MGLISSRPCRPSAITHRSRVGQRQEGHCKRPLEGPQVRPPSAKAAWGARPAIIVANATNPEKAFHFGFLRYGWSENQPENYVSSLPTSIENVREKTLGSGLK